MATTSHCPVPFSGTLASDLLRSSSNGVAGMPLKALGRTQVSVRRKGFSVDAKLRKVKKQEYPWPDDADPNVKGGILSHLSHFKPLKERPKPVTLEFEKPLVDFEKKIMEVRKMADETGLDFSDQIISLESKYQQALKDLYTHLTPIQRVNIARHPNRPTFLDHVFSITDKFVELHGDRAGYDDPAIVTGIGTIDGKRYMFIGQQKGRNTKENIHRNFGMPTPHGYRKALRMMYYADHHKFPIVTFIDTPGAYADLKSEELGQGEAIAHNLRSMFGLKVPVVSIVIGEGGSGGALAIGCANKLLMLENAVFYVASPEACAAILWKSAKASPKAAEKLKITAKELCKLQIADGVIPEPIGGAHADPSWTSQQIKSAINEAMDELGMMNAQELITHRMLKFRKIGGFQEGVPIEPQRKVNMKKKDEPTVGKTSLHELKSKVEQVKQNILKESSEKNSKTAALKREINKKFAEIVNRSDIKEKYDLIKEEVESLGGVSAFEDFEPDVKKKFIELKKEIELEVVGALQSMGLTVEIIKTKAKEQTERILFSKFSSRMDQLNEAITKEIERIVNSTDLKDKVELLKLEVAKAGKSPDSTSKNRISAMEQQIKQRVAAALDSSNLKLKHEKLSEEISEFLESSELEGILKEKPTGDDLTHDEARLEVNAGTNHMFA